MSRHRRNLMGFFTRHNPLSVPSNGQNDPSAITVSRVGASQRRAAIGRLVGTGPQDTAVDAFIMQAGHEGVDLGLLWMASPTSSPSGAALEVALLIPAPGRTAVVLVSSSVNVQGGKAEDLSQRLRAAAIDACCEHARTASGGGLRLAQALIDPDADELISAYSQAGFVHLADLAYLRRERRALTKLVETHTASLPESLRIVCYADLPARERDVQLGCALEASYVGTLDCPILCGMRTTDDVIISHKAVGTFDPRSWWLILEDGAAAGCLLLSPVPASGTIELVYLGIAPSLRGVHRTGQATQASVGGSVASTLLAHGLRALPPSSEDTLSCAVDVGNTPAMRFYSRWKLRRFATKSAFVRPLRE